MILMDSKGDKIQVSVKKDEFNQWREYLVENNTYVMYNFNVFHNDLQFKACNHAYRMQFTVDTTLRDKEFPEIPQFEFVFKKFADILAGNFESDLLVDIIGAIDKMVFSQTQASLKKVIFNLKDSR
ncbi:PREDICTED: uncharacterized protein LOC109357934 [Lupinus angustifolius]|uniref:uncharacterized protein LOC109357934 n=1 Tax=Lupinus angustifolius TaxID=3871 RepID=UPI00092FC9B5|nr:PREDICTED: uncharacterized protein LOC109357934 [Lupinus angustifolius]